jgi:exosortase
MTQARDLGLGIPAIPAEKSMALSMGRAIEAAPRAARPYAGVPQPWILVAAALALVYLPHLFAYGENLMEREHYQFFPLAWMGAAALLWIRRDELRPRAARRAGLGWIGVGIGAAMLAAAGVMNSSWLAMAAALPLAAGFAWLVGGWATLRAAAPAMVLFATTIRPPGSFDADLIRELRALAVDASSRVLDQLGVIHVPWGNALRVPAGDLLVDEACSGINSLVSIVAVVLFVGLLLRRPALHLLGLLAGSAAIVVLANVARITIVTLAFARWKVDLLHGWRHDALGLALYAVSLALAASLDQLLLLLGSLIPGRAARRAAAGMGRDAYGSGWIDAPAAADPARSSTPTPAARGTRSGRPIACAVAFAAIALITPARWTYAVLVPEPGEASVAQIVARAQRTLGERSMPAELDGWSLDGFKAEERERSSPFGLHSAVWRYDKDTRTAQVSVDYPFRGWHNLIACYEATEWKLRGSREIRGEAETEAAPAPVYTEAVLSNPRGQFAVLYYGFVDDRAQWVAAPARSGLGIAGREMPWELTPKHPVYQFQVFSTGYAPPSAEERQQIARLFEAASREFRDRLFAPGAIAP